MAQFFRPTQVHKSAAKTAQVEISALSLQGEGIAEYQGQKLYLADALPGDVMRVQLAKSKQGFEVNKQLCLTPSPLRIEPRCQHAGACGGCPLMSLNAADALRFKEDALQQKLRQLAPDLSWQPVLSAEPWFYRRSARLALRRGKRGWELGFRQAQSHQLASIDQCQVLAEPLRQTLPLLSTWLLTLARDCPLGHIDLLLAEGQVAVQLHVSEADESLLDSFRQLCQQQLWFGYYSCRQQTQVLQSQALFYRLDELQIGCTPSDFIQVNGKINELMLQQAIQWLELDAQSVVMDAFSGIGNFSLPLAKRVKHVVAVEGIEVMTQRLLANATANGLTNVTAYSGDLSQAQSWQLALSSATHVLLDPARAGAVAVADAVRDSAVKRMLYISCNPLTLVRDLRALVNDGWQLQQAGAVDMFPHTKHLEAMVLLSR